MAAETPAAARPSIFVEATGAQTFVGADAHIRQPGDAAPGGPVIWCCAPGNAIPDAAQVCVADGGLGAAARLRAETVGTLVVPRVEVQRAARSYGFSTDSSGSGFSTYHLDPATAAGFEVDDGGRLISIADWLAEAEQLGFSEVWLHSRDAAAAERGFAGDLLGRAHRAAPDLGIWLSGGGAAPADIARISGQPGLVALVVSPVALGAQALQISGADDRRATSIA